MGKDESNENKMNANAAHFTPTSYNRQNTYSRVPAPAANEGGSQSGDQQSQQPFDQQQLYSQWGGFPTSTNWQNSYSYSQAPTTNKGTIPYDTTYSAKYTRPSYDPSVNTQQPYDIPQRGKKRGSNSFSQAPAANGWTSPYGATIPVGNAWFLQNPSVDQQRQQEFKPIKFMKEDLFLKKELPKFLRDNSKFEPLLVLFPYYEETKNLIESFDPEEKFTYKNKDGSSHTFTLFEKKQRLWNRAKKKYLAQVDKLQRYSTQWQELGDDQRKKEKTKKILKNFISKYDTSVAVQMSLCFDIYNEGFKECVNDILDNKDIEPKEEDYGKERTKKYEEKKKKYDDFKETYKEKLEEQENFATFKIESDVPSMQKATTKRILDQGFDNSISMILEAQELFYFASNIFKNLYAGQNENDELSFFNNYINTIRNTDELRGTKDSIGDKLNKLKENMASNFSAKPKAEIIYTVLNGLANALPYKDIIEQIWKGTFLSNCYTDELQATSSRIKLNLIESTLAKDLSIYKTQELQSALYDYLTTLENTGLTKEELDIRRNLLIKVKTREELEKFKKNLVDDLVSKKEGSETEYKIDDDALEGILSLAANNGINISLDNEKLNSRISNYIYSVETENRNDIEALSKIIYTMLYHSDTETLLKQDNGIIQALKTKLSEIKEEIHKKITQEEKCEPYLFYNVITIDKFMDYYESKKSKKQLLESVKSPKQEIETSIDEKEPQIMQKEVFNYEFLDNLRENFKNLIQDESFTFNKGKAIITFINYYASKLGTEVKQEQLSRLKQDLETQLEENAEKKELIEDLISKLEDVSTDEPENSGGQKTDAKSQSKNTESRSYTVSQFESCIKDIIKETFKATENDSFTIGTQHKTASREVDFYIIFKENCSIKIAEGFEIPIKAGTKIVIEADGATHFENTIPPENLKEAQHAITGKTIERNYEIKGALIDNKASCDSLKERVLKLEDNENHLLKCACYLQKFKQRRKHLDPTIDSELSTDFYKLEAETEKLVTSDVINSSGNIPQPQESPQDTKKDEENSVLLEMTPELRDLQNTLQYEDVKEVISESIKKSRLFVSIPQLTSCIENGRYQKEEIKKVFLNCFINAYCSQALSNLKEFYRQEAEEEKKELENTKTTQPSQQEQNGDQTTQEGKNEMLASLQVVGNCKTNRETVGISALTQISDAREKEKTAIEEYFPRPKNTRTSGRVNTL